MNTFKSTILMALCSFSLLATSPIHSLGANKINSSPSSKPSVPYGRYDRIQFAQSQAQPQPIRGKRKKQMGLGIASGASSVVYLDAAPSLWLRMGKRQAAQFYLGVGSTSPGFTFGAGGTYKYTISGTGNSGLHIGGGLGLGTVSSAFYVNFSGLMGIHMFFPGLDHILFNFDAGATLSVLDGSVLFFAKGYSSLLGLSIHYLF